MSTELKSPVDIIESPTTQQWDIIKKFFSERGLIQHSLESMDHFYEIAKQIVQGYSLPPIEDSRSGSKKIFTFGNVVVHPPKYFPHECRLRNLHYNVDASFEVIENEISSLGVAKITNHPCYKFCELPLMLKTARCKLYNLSEEETYKAGECQYDIGGYFIVNGKEKVIVSQERMGYNQLLIFTPQKVNEKNKYSFVAELRSVTVRGSKPSVIRLLLSSDKTGIDVILPNLKTPINLGAVLHSLGADSDEKIRTLIKGPESDEKKEGIQNESEDNCFTGLPAFNDMIESFLHTSSVYRDEGSIDYIGGFISESVDKKQRNEFAQRLITDEILTQLGVDNKKKLFFIGYMIQQLLMTAANMRSPDDRDSFILKRVDTAGKLFEDLFRGFFEKYVENVKEKLTTHPSNLSIFERDTTITVGIRGCMNTGNWGHQKHGYRKVGVCQLLTRLNYASVMSHIRRMCSNRSTQGKVTKMRQLHHTQWGLFDPNETPEGEGAGVIKNMSIICNITVEVSNIPVKRFITESKEVRQLDWTNVHLCKIFVDGDIIGVTEHPAELVSELKQMRQSGAISHSISIVYRKYDNIVVLSAEAGRTNRPLMVVKDGRLNIPSSISSLSWFDLIDSGVIRYIDTSEEEYSLIATFPENIRPDTDYCEIHPALILGVVTGAIPFSDHCPGPRNSYADNMAKQAMGLYALNFLQRYETSSYVLHYPQKPIVCNKIAELMNYDKLPSGQNCIVAVLAGGYNQEDSVIANQGAIDRGLFTISIYKTYTGEERNQGNQIIETIEIPPEKNMVRGRNYLKLDENGIIRPGERVCKDDIIIAKTTRRDGKNGNPIDSSLYYKMDEVGRVDSVLYTRNADGNKMIKVRIVFVRNLITGDKVASLTAQKGTDGICLSQEDMPFTESGMVPDLIINPACLPSRMTIHQLISCVVGKYGVATGEFQDGTPFPTGKNRIPYVMNEIGQGLASKGFRRAGEEVMIDGRTGERYKTTIFMGPTYYQRLKHLILDKLSARSTGPLTPLLHQPANHGRKNGIEFTAIRVGTMETDAIVSHGGMGSLYERLMVSSDKYPTSVCKGCGRIPNTKVCCGEVVDIHVPYVFKLICQNVAALQISTRMRVK